MKLKIKLSITCSFIMILLAGFYVSAQPIDISAVELLTTAITLEKPIGVEAVDIFERIKSDSFENNVEFSNSWINQQTAFYDAASEEYRNSVEEMIQGGGDEGGLGLGHWLTDPNNAAVWDEAVKSNIGEEGYARVVALNAAFSPQNDNNELFYLTYGGERRFEEATNTLRLQGTNVVTLDLIDLRLVTSNDASLTQIWDEQVKFGDAVRVQMFEFYKAFNEGTITPDQVATFNAAYLAAGGCALAATDVSTELKAERYSNALNLMAKTLGELGFSVTQ